MSAEILVLVPIGTLAFLTVAVLASHKEKLAKQDEKRERLITLQKALEHGGLDDATRAELLRVVTGDKVEKKAAPVAPIAPRVASCLSRFTFGHLFVAAGWICACVAIGLLCLGGRDEEEVGTVMLPISIGVLCLPFAWREFERRTERA